MDSIDTEESRVHGCYIDASNYRRIVKRIGSDGKEYSEWESVGVFAIRRPLPLDEITPQPTQEKEKDNG